MLASGTLIVRVSAKGDIQGNAVSAAERLEPLSAFAAPAAPLKPTAWHKLTYSLGQSPQSGGFDTAIAFAFFYYTAVLGLSGALVGLALGVSLAFDAVVDPLVGSWSDGLQARLGRRLTPMLLATPLMALALIGLFAPPKGLSPLLLFGWLTVASVSARSFISLFNVPYFALGAEMADDYVERSSIVSYRALAGLVFGVAVNLIAFSVFFGGKMGLRRADAYPGFGLVSALIVAVPSLVCVLGLRGYVARLRQPTPHREAMWRRLPGEVAEVFSNRSFRQLFIGSVIFGAGVGLNGALNSHAAVYVWRLPPKALQLPTYAYILGILGGVVITPTLLRWFEKRTLVLVGLGDIIAIWTALPVLRAVGVIHWIGAAAVPPLMINALVVGVGVGLLAVALPSMMADAADEHEYLTGNARQGLYSSGLGFAGKAAAGLGAMVAGLALDIIGFPVAPGVGAPAVISEPIIQRLMIAHGPAAAVLGVTALFFTGAYAVTRKRHAEILRALEARRGSTINHVGLAE